jgi:hypothetical protein
MSEGGGYVDWDVVDALGGSCQAMESGPGPRASLGERPVPQHEQGVSEPHDVGEDIAQPLLGRSARDGLSEPLEEPLGVPRRPAPISADLDRHLRAAAVDPAEELVQVGDQDVDPFALDVHAYMWVYSGPLPPSGGVSRPPLAVMAPHWTQFEGVISTSTMPPASARSS